MPLVIVNFTFLVSEEPSLPQSPSPPPPVVAQEANVLLGDMTGVVSQAEHIQEDSPAEEQHQHAPEPTLNQPADIAVQKEDTLAP